MKKESQINQIDRICMLLSMGGVNLDMRKKSVDELIEIGLDGYGFGGYSIDEE